MASAVREVPVKLLEDIVTFPVDSPRRTLEKEYGIDSAEAFFENATHNPQGMADALKSDRAEVDRLITMVEGFRPTGFRERCRKPVHRPRAGHRPLSPGSAIGFHGIEPDILEEERPVPGGSGSSRPTAGPTNSGRGRRLLRGRPAQRRSRPGTPRGRHRAANGATA